MAVHCLVFVGPQIEAKDGITSVTILLPSFPQSTQDVWKMNMWLELPEKHWWPTNFQT